MIIFIFYFWTHKSNNLIIHLILSEISKKVESKIYSMIFKSITELANDFIDKIIESPMKIPFYAKCYEQLIKCYRNSYYEFHQAFEERVGNFKTTSERCINITWIESLKAELCINVFWKCGVVIKDVANHILFVDREQTIIFVIILHKIWRPLKREDPEMFNKCLGYLKQIIGIIPTSDEFWEPEENKIDQDLKLKVHRKELERYQFNIDDFSLERAKFIFKKAFEERDYISKALSVMENNLGLRLLKVHLSFLCKFKFMTENLEFDMNNEDNPKNVKTSALVRVVGRFYECEIINWQTIMDITNYLINTKNVHVQAIFCITVGVKTKYEPDPMFKCARNFINQICETYEEIDDRKTNYG